MPEPKRDWIPILANPRAGTGKRNSRLAELVDRLTRAGFDPRLFHDREQFQSALEQPGNRARCRCVVAAGGDGTIAWVINRHREFPLAIFPTGSENLLARHFGIRRRPGEVADMIIEDRRYRLDLGNVNGHRFTLMATAGFDAHIVDLVHRRRVGHVQRWHYAMAILRAFYGYRYPKLTIYVDDDPQPLFAYHAMVLNLPDYALRLSFHQRASGQDGRLDLVMLNRAGRIQVVRYLLALLLGRFDELPDVLHRRIQQVRVEADESVAIQADGDPAGVLPARFTVEPGAMELLIPRAFEEVPPAEGP